MIKKSFRLKIALWSCIISGTVMTISLATVVIFVRIELSELIDHDMEAIAAAVASSFAGGAHAADPFRAIGNFDTDSFQGANLQAKYEPVEQNVRLMAVLDAQGSFLFKNSRYWKDDYFAPLAESGELRLRTMPLAEDAAAIHRDSDDAGQDGRWEVRRYKIKGTTIFLALHQTEYIDEYQEVARLALASIPIALILIGLGGWWIGCYAVRPVSSILRVVESVEPEELSTRIPHSSRDDEIGALARVINKMLDRIEKGYNQAKRFTENASHELRTPLAILQAELEAKMRNSDKDLQEFEDMLSEIRRLKALTYSLLFLSKIDSGNIDISRSRIDLLELTRQVMEDIRDMSDQLELSYAIKGLVTEAVCYGDSSLLQQCLMNLFRNASKFNRADGKVSCEVLDKESKWAIRIGNTGQRIPDKDRKKIFDRFYRSDSDPNRERGGFGLGLNISREIARIHGGDIQLIKSEDDWIEFEITLPKD